ncbi:hypothetical protein [Desulfofustis limnaeus]|uniref:hypothetical protein n=1 Tax=Desulfofustis limnaeus TaxID=2740163 RepID=UPI0024E03D95|nr:hypothetical protein [Desulfofustis limnaeus]
MQKETLKKCHYVRLDCWVFFVFGRVPELTVPYGQRTFERYCTACRRHRQGLPLL